MVRASQPTEDTGHDHPAEARSDARSRRARRRGRRGRGALAQAAGGAGSAEARAVFERFVAAQNAHDAAAVEALLWDSPDFLWITRGQAVWGRAAAMERFRALYQGTWKLEPDMAPFRAAALGEGAAQLFAPVLFTIGPAGRPAQPQRFLMDQTLRREGGAWRVASIPPIPVPPGRGVPSAASRPSARAWLTEARHGS